MTDSDAEMIQAAVLWKDEHIIAINKPPGLPSQGGSGRNPPSSSFSPSPAMSMAFWRPRLTVTDRASARVMTFLNPSSPTFSTCRLNIE